MFSRKIGEMAECIEQEPRLRKIVEFVNDNDLVKMKAGHYVIDGMELYMNIDEYRTQPFEQRKYEAHEEYVDVQCILSGQESIFIEHVRDLRVKDSYDPERDIAFLEDGKKPVRFDLHEGDFMVIYPGEAHKPCVVLEQECEVKKAVFKIKV